jgi:CRISPR-associated protein Csb1
MRHLTTQGRWLLEVGLEPIAGARFQPTGFPDIGAATYERPVRDNGPVRTVTALVVESTQSMANHLEATAWDKGNQAPEAVFDGLPYVRVVAAEDGRYLTSSRTEAHRLASAFIKDAALDGQEMRDVIRDRLGLREDTPLAPREIASAVFALDPFCLVHGVFFAESAKVWPGQPKVARALTAFIEATDVARAESGGVKRDDVRHQIGETGGAAEGYGFVPFHRTEWSAADITASFVLDRRQLASYGLPDEATELLEAIAHWEIRTLLDEGLRLRTFCDLAASGSVDEALPPKAELDTRVRDLVSSCRSLLDGGDPLVVEWSPKTKTKTKS